MISTILNTIKNYEKYNPTTFIQCMLFSLVKAQTNYYPDATGK